MDETTLYTFSAQEALPLAWKYYLKTCGLGEKADSPRQARMLARSSELIGDVLPQVNLQALTRRFPGGCIAGETLLFDGVRFGCRALGRLDPARVGAVYPYLLTAGEIRLETENVADLLFADIWGTAFADAGVALLREKLSRENEGYVLSSAFGPGFFGMEVTELAGFFELFDASAIGMSLRASCLLIPLKSVAGFFISLLDEWALPAADCESCLGNPGGCRFCRNYVAAHKS